LRSIRSFGAFLFVVAALCGCDNSTLPAVESPPGMATTSAAPTATSAPAEPTAATTASAAPSATPTTAPAATPTTQASTAPASGAELQWVGSWTSPSCGGRTFERRLVLKQDKTFSAQDLVSPCPPKVQCVWAGIVFWSGTWAVDEKGAVLTKTTGGKDPTKKSRTDEPLRLTWDRAAAAPAEASDSGAACVYAKAKDESSKP
jgi:hypothetical protein